ncbi:hypothetical protein ACFFX0_20050 [Citricoccus parietis]|uniref:Uncharacterized protein n=1 Tax=Citricoccus parietis TaxID=592307 RepID=A0ABV5G361_9MICC
MASWHPAAARHCTAVRPASCPRNGTDSVTGRPPPWGWTRAWRGSSRSSCAGGRWWVPGVTWPSPCSPRPGCPRIPGRGASGCCGVWTRSWLRGTSPRPRCGPRLWRTCPRPPCDPPCWATCPPPPDTTTVPGRNWSLGGQRPRAGARRCGRRGPADGAARGGVLGRAHDGPLGRAGHGPDRARHPGTHRVRGDLRLGSLRSGAHGRGGAQL